jgi:hypothetical protein
MKKQLLIASAVLTLTAFSASSQTGTRPGQAPRVNPPPTSLDQGAGQQGVGQSGVGQSGRVSPAGTNLPPGLQGREQLPPGLSRRDQLPPGLANRTNQFGTNQFSGTNSFGTNQFGGGTNQFGTNQFGSLTNQLGTNLAPTSNTNRPRNLYRDRTTLPGTSSRTNSPTPGQTP